MEQYEKKNVAMLVSNALTMKRNNMLSYDEHLNTDQEITLF